MNRKTLPDTPVQQSAGPNRAYLPIVERDSGSPTPSPTPLTLTQADAARFLAQAAFGAAPEDLAPLAQSGFAAWLTQQRALPISRVRPYLEQIRTDVFTNNPPADTVPYHRPVVNDFASTANLSTAWMRNIVFGPDQLRQRVAWSLSQIMVVSFNSVARLFQNGVVMADYYDTLAQHALGNFRDLLLAVSLHPAMAYFLSSLGNEKADPASNQYPDENYAREVMQLFTIGLWELGPDGEQKRDANNNPIPTYDNADVEELARVFTGLWFAGKTWPTDGANFPSQWLTEFALAMFEAQHDRGAKTIFHGKPWQRVLPAGVNGVQDITATIDALVAHPNTAPFISKALIKFLVTSNPSPAYVKRVADVFVDNGAGVRGDLFAVVKTILLDNDARNQAQLSNPRHGKLQEPLVRVARLVRAFHAGKTTPNLQFWGLAKPGALMQWPAFSPSVFNFFAPGYRHLGLLAQNGLTSPEFQILNSVSVATGSNMFAEFVDSLLHQRLAGGTPRFEFDFAPERALASNPNALADRLNLLLCNGLMGAGTRQRIVDGINGLPASDDEERVRLAVWLTAVSPEAAILR